MAGQDWEALEQAVAAQPGEVGLLVNLATAYAHAERLADAAGAFQRAAELAPDSLDIQLGLAAVQHARGDTAGLEAAIHRALEIDPNHPELWLTIYEVSDPEEHLIDRLVGAARYLAVAGDAPDTEALRAELEQGLANAASRLEQAPPGDAETEAWSAELLELLPYAAEALPAAIFGPLAERLHAGHQRLLAAPPEATLNEDEPEAAPTAEDGVGDEAGAAPAAPAPAEVSVGAEVVADAPAAVPGETGAMVHVEAPVPPVESVPLAVAAEAEATPDAEPAGVADDTAGDEPAAKAHDSAGDETDDGAEAEPLRPELLTHVPDLGAPEPRDSTPLDLSLEAPASAPAEFGAAAQADGDALLEQADRLLAANQTEEALLLFEQSLEVLDDRAPQAVAWCGIARCRQRLGQRAEARAAADHAAELDARSPAPFLLQVEFALAEDNLKVALAAAQFAEAAAPDDARVQRALGLVLGRLEDWPAALDALEKACAAMPDDAELVCRLGEAYLATGRTDHAAVCFEEALRLGLPEPAATDLREFLASPRATPHEPAPEPDEEPAEFDPDALPAEGRAVAPAVSQELRDRMIRKTATELLFDPETQKKCRLCRTINPLDAEVCQKCGQSFAAAEQMQASPAAGANRPCFIATAACGQPTAPEVVVLRAWRDRCLLGRPAGRAVAAAYDRLSPPAARWIADRPVWQGRVRRWLIAPLARQAARRLDRLAATPSGTSGGTERGGGTDRGALR